MKTFISTMLPVPSRKCCF